MLDIDLDCGKVIQLRARRPLVGAVSLASIGNEIRRGVSSHMVWFSHLDTFLVVSPDFRFVLCQPRAHFTRLIHPGWGRCGHGPSSLWESRDMQVIHSLFVFFFFWCTLKGGQQSFIMAHLKLRDSSAPFFQRHQYCSRGWSQHWLQVSFS